MTLLTQNSKMKKSGEGKDLKILNFTLPALKTCPSARHCRKGCFGLQGTYLFGNVKEKHEANWTSTYDLESFFTHISDELKRYKPTHVRIHDTGDFYTPEYFWNWVKIARSFPDIIFYAYTKEVLMIKTETIGIGGYKNLPIRLIFSYGGEHDALINKRQDRHSIVFKTMDDLVKAGYTYANDDDLAAIGNDQRIGLVYHGRKGYEKTEWDQVNTDVDAIIQVIEQEDIAA